MPPFASAKLKVASVFCQHMTTVEAKPTMATNLKRRLNVGSMPKRSISRTSWAVGLRLSDLRSNSRARISSSKVVSRAWLPAEPLVSRGKDSAPAMVMEEDTDGGLVSDDGRGKERN